MYMYIHACTVHVILYMYIRVCVRYVRVRVYMCATCIHVHTCTIHVANMYTRTRMYRTCTVHATTLSRSQCNTAHRYTHTHNLQIGD